MPIQGFDDDIAHVLAHVGDIVVYGTQKGYGLLDSPGLDVFDPTQFRFKGYARVLVIREGAFDGLTQDAVVTVAGVVYAIRDIGNAGTDGLRRLMVTYGPPVAPLQPVDHVVVAPTVAAGILGATVQLTATLYDQLNNPLTGRAITWTSSNPAVATVSGAGLVTIVGIGSCTISATAEFKTGTATAEDVFTQLKQQVNALGGGTVGMTMLQLYVKGVNQTVGAGKCTLWDDAVNPGQGKHWRPSADFGGGAGADVAGDGAIIGQGLEIPYSAGLSSTLQIGHNDLTSDTSGAIPNSGGLFDVGADRGAGITWGGFGKMRVNTTIFVVGELADSDRMEISMNKGSDYPIVAANAGTNTVYGVDGIWSQTEGSKIMHYAQWCALTPNRTHSTPVPLYCRRYGRDVVIDQSYRDQNPLKSGQRLRTLVFDGGWAPSAATAQHLLYIGTGRANAAQTKLLNDFAESWLGAGNVWSDPRPNIFYLFGDSFQPGQPAIQRGENGSPVLPNCAVSIVARSGDTVNYDQFIIAHYLQDGDYSRRSLIIPAIGEWLNEFADSLSNTATELARNYYWGDFLEAIDPAKFRNIFYNFTYATGASRAVNDPTITNDLIANAVAGGHAYGFLNVLQSLMYDPYHYNDVPASEPAVLWDGSSGHPAAGLGQEYLTAFYRGMAYLGMGVDDSAIPMKIDPLVSHISLSAGTPTGSTTWTVKNRAGGTIVGRTLTFSSLDTGIATVNSSTGVVTRVAAGRARIKVVTDLGAVGVLAVDVS